MTKPLLTKTPKKIFKTPVVEFTAFSDDDVANIVSQDTFKNLIRGFSYESIKFHHKLPTAKLFVIKNTNYCYNVKRESYKTLLQDCLKQFEKDEDYIKCSECKKLIETL